MRIHYLQHVPFEDLANIAPWAKAKGHVVTGTALHAGESLPPLEAVDWLIVLGGSMSVGDTIEYPWLSSEKAFIREAIEAGRLVLGICLGAQLMAHALDAQVRHAGRQEVGWYPVTLTKAGERSALFEGVPQTFMAFHWHGDTFEIPEGAQHVGKSTACLNQGFTYGDRVLGLQFHVETSQAAAERMIAHCPQDMGAGEYSQDADTIRLGRTHIAGMEAVMATILNNLEAQG